MSGEDRRPPTSLLHEGEPPTGDRCIGALPCSRPAASFATVSSGGIDSVSCRVGRERPPRAEPRPAPPRRAPKLERRKLALRTHQITLDMTVARARSTPIAGKMCSARSPPHSRRAERYPALHAPYICSTVAMPSNPSPVRSVRAVTSLKSRRLRRNASSPAESTGQRS